MGQRHVCQVCYSIVNATDISVRSQIIDSSSGFQKLECYCPIAVVIEFVHFMVGPKIIPIYIVRTDMPHSFHTCLYKRLAPFFVDFLCNRESYKQVTMLPTRNLPI
jgi:hypothetical protein